MLTSTKRTIAVMTAAACLGGAGWAIAASSGSGGSGTAPATGQPGTQGPSLPQDIATPPAGRNCPNHDGGGGGGGSPAAPSPGSGGGSGDGTGVPPATGGQSEI